MTALDWLRPVTPSMLSDCCSEKPTAEVSRRPAPKLKPSTTSVVTV